MTELPVEQIYFKQNGIFKASYLKKRCLKPRCSTLLTAFKIHFSNCCKTIAIRHQFIQLKAVNQSKFKFTFNSIPLRVSCTITGLMILSRNWENCVCAPSLASSCNKAAMFAALTVSSLNGTKK